MTQPNQSELEKQINNIMFNEMGATGWNGSTKAIVYLNARNALTAYITANYTANSEVAERERAARIDEIRRTRPHLTYPGMVYYGERMNELRSNETEEI